MLRSFALLFLLLACASSRAATYTFTWSANCSRAYEAYLSLHIQDARSLLVTEIKADPYNLAPVYIADYEDCILLLLNCDPTDLGQREGHLDERIALLDQGDERSPWTRFCKAGVYLHWAIIHLRFGHQYTAARYFHRSFALLKDNQRQFPSFGYNVPFAGLEEAVVGSLPGSYRWLASIFGMKGSIKKGTEKLGSFVNTHEKGQPLYSETVLYYLYTRFYLLQQQREVWEYLCGTRFSAEGNLLNTFVKANLALDYRKADAALQVLTAAIKEPAYSHYPILDYQAGVALLYRADTACARYFQQYLRNNKSDLYIRDCWQKMAFAWYINGNMQQAEYCRAQISRSGSGRIDADKQALRFAGSGAWPSKKLLQARLFIEGGYNSQALALLGSVDLHTITHPADKAEYYFRLGRVYEETGQSEKALVQYSYCISIGKDRHEQFAARAALHTGRIYEQAGDRAKALAAYEQCLAMPAHDFQNSIDQQAKAGINRLEISN